MSNLINDGDFLSRNSWIIENDARYCCTQYYTYPTCMELISEASISQKINVTPYTDYILTFHLKHFQEIANFKIIINGFEQEITSFKNGSFKRYCYNFNALEKNNIVLNFVCINGPIYIDHVSLIVDLDSRHCGESIVYCKNVGQKKYNAMRLFEIINSNHEIYDVKRRKFVPVIHNIVTENNTKFAFIRKNFFRQGLPNDDVYLISGATIMIDGVVKRVRDIPGVVIVKTPPQKAYQICTEIKCFTVMNNVPVMCWGKKDWDNYCEKSGVEWKENEIPN